MSYQNGNSGTMPLNSSKNSNRSVQRSTQYPQSNTEQKELDDFLNENLSTGCICPSKLSMASPIFFFKKKDGKL